MKPLTVIERRNKILDILNQEGRVSVVDLSKMFNVSNVIIRSDLTELENDNMLSRVHGGAITSYKSYYDMNFIQRINIHSDEKESIAEKVNTFIKDDTTIVMNAGTTSLFVVRTIKSQNVTIVTNSIALALEGARKHNLKIILLGGEVDSQYQFTYGVNVESSLEQYNADLSILSVDGIDINKGLSTYYYQEATICKKMIKQSKRVIVAADYTKIGRSSFAKIDNIQAIDTIVTNSKASADYLKKLKSKGIEIIT